MKWVTGPLGFPASEDWKYWVPTLPNGKFRAWAYTFGWPKKETLLGDDLATLEEAQKLCDEHLATK